MAGVDGRVALVTGAGRGIGRAAAELLASRGARVMGVARSEKELEAVGLEYTVADLGTVEGCASAVSQTEQRLGPIEIFVCNHGIGSAHERVIWEQDTEHWEETMRINLDGPFYLSRLVLKGMVERGYGRIVNITSSSVKSPIPTLGLSNGARAGLTGFVAGVARQVVAKGVTINGILPGPFDTDRLRSGIRYIAEQSGRDFEEEFEQACVAIANRLFTATPGPAKGLLTGAGCDALRVRPGQTRPGLGRIQPKQNVQIAPFELVGPMAMELRVEGIDEPLARGFPIVRLRPRRPERR